MYTHCDEMSHMILDYSLNTSQNLQTSCHDTGNIKITKSICGHHTLSAAAFTDHKKQYTRLAQTSQVQSTHS